MPTIYGSNTIDITGTKVKVKQVLLKGQNDLLPIAKDIVVSTRGWLQTAIPELRNNPDPKNRRLAITLGGSIGDPAAVPWLLALMKEPLAARGAGEAFSFITGVDLEEQKLDAKKPEGFESGPTDNPEDTDVDMDPDDDLPWPDAAKVADRWKAIQGTLAAGKRYLLGKEITPDQAWAVLRTGKQRQRAAAALELALRSAGKPLFNVAAPGFRQVLDVAGSGG